MIVIAIIGILAAIALPAYSSYLKKAKFTEVSNVVESVKTPIALCIQEFGVNAVEGHCVNSEGAGSEGFGWELKKTGEYETKYVSSIAVSAANGEEGSAKEGLITITATAKEDVFGDAYTLTLNGNWTAAGQLDWKIDAENSTCDEAKLCKAE